MPQVQALGMRISWLRLRLRLQLRLRLCRVTCCGTWPRRPPP